MKTRSKVIFATILAVAGAFAVSASATTFYCPGTPTGADSIDRYLKLETSVAITCLASGTEPTAGQTFEALYPDATFIGKEEEDDAGNAGNPLEGEDVLAGIIDETSGSLYGGVSGALDFTDPGTYDSYVVLMKFGLPHLADSWFAFEIPADDFNIVWSAINDAGNLTRNALSHTGLYGLATTTTIPLPAGGLLLLTGAGSLLALRRRRKAA